MLSLLSGAGMLNVLTACLALAVLLLSWRIIKRRSSATTPQTPVFQSAGATVEGLRQLSELVSLRIQIADILSIEQRGWFSGYKGAWVVKGDALCMTDLRAAIISDLSDERGRPHIRVELLEPSVK